LLLIPKTEISGNTPLELLSECLLISRDLPNIKYNKEIKEMKAIIFVALVACAFATNFA
jgi:hypothetical protein